jgi:uncharacterized iron-regulated membrane protein
MARGMAKTGRKQLRALWLQVHKWIGLTLAILIIPVSLTGSALVWHDALDAWLEPKRFATIGPAALPPSAYAEAARPALPAGAVLSTLRFNDEGKPVVAVGTKAPPPGTQARPERTSVWLNPTDGQVIDQATGNSGLVQTMHVLHGSMMIPGGWGRPIVGWVGVFMFLSCLTGIWLWWPLSGNFTSGFKWKRRNTTNANLHYLTGFWVLVPLAMLSFTGAWISFPKVFSQFEARPAASAGGGREAAMRAQPLAQPASGIDQAAAASTPFATGPLTAIAWPTDQKAEWKISYARKGGNAEISVADRTLTAKPPSPPQPETIARAMRRWHDGTGMGLGWQIVIFLGGIIPAILSITGIIIWWRARKPRSKVAAHRRALA